MKASRLFAQLSLVVIVALCVGFVATGPAAAKSPDNSQEGGNNKILVTNVPAGNAIMVVPAGGISGSILSETGGTIETFAHVGTPTEVFLWDPNRGQVLLGTVTAGSAWPDTVLDANSAKFPNQAMASPAIGGESQSSQMSLNQTQTGQSGINQGMSQQGSTLPSQGGIPQATNPVTGTGSLTGTSSIWGPGFINRGLASATQFSQDYTIQPGDNLGLIAKKFGTTVADLASVNNIALPVGFIRAGAVIKVPAQPMLNSQSNLSNQGTNMNQGTGGTDMNQGMNQGGTTPGGTTPGGSSGSGSSGSGSSDGSSGGSSSGGTDGSSGGSSSGSGG